MPVSFHNEFSSISAWPDLRSDEDYQTKTSLNQPVQEPDEEPSSHEIDQTLQHLARAGNMRNSAGWLRRPRPAVRMGEEEPEGEEQQEQKEVPEDGVANGRLKKNGRKEERGEGSREKAEEEDVAEEVEDNDEGQSPYLMNINRGHFRRPRTTKRL
jgi:hypothetical protein